MQKTLKVYLLMGVYWKTIFQYIDTEVSMFATLPEIHFVSFKGQLFYIQLIFARCCLKVCVLFSSHSNIVFIVSLMSSQR